MKLFELANDRNRKYSDYVEIECDECGAKKIRRVHFLKMRYLNKGRIQYLCKSCSRKGERNWSRHYTGAMIQAAQSPEAKAKRSRTNLERYGVDNPIKLVPKGVSRQHWEKYLKGRKLSSEEKTKLVERMTGSHNPNWKGGQYQNQSHRNRRFRHKFPEIQSAHNKVARAIQIGKLKRKPCVICKEPDAEAHHEDYLKPLKVVWLCKRHHDLIHGKQVNG